MTDPMSTPLTARGRALLTARAAALRARTRELEAVEPAERDSTLHLELTRLSAELQTIDATLAKATSTLELPSDVTIVEIGDTVTVEDTDGERSTYVVTHGIEATFAEEAVSIDSPLGAGLLGHRVGERVEIDAPVGPRVYEVIAIRRV